MNNIFSKNHILFLLAVAFLSFIIWGLFGQKDTASVKGQTEKTVLVSIGQARITAFVADTDALRAKGLGDRDSIPPDAGMLFVFGTPGEYSFWMKDMRFPIDMIWIGADGRVVFEKENVSPATFPEIFTPNAPAKYVLEANAGFAEKNGVKIGSSVSF